MTLTQAWPGVAYPGLTYPSWLTDSSTVACRIWQVPAEQRAFAVPAESRVCVVPVESRKVVVACPL